MFRVKSRFLYIRWKEMKNVPLTLSLEYFITSMNKKQTKISIRFHSDDDPFFFEPRRRFFFSFFLFCSPHHIRQKNETNKQKQTN